MLPQQRFYVDVRLSAEATTLSEALLLLRCQTTKPIKEEDVRIHGPNQAVESYPSPPDGATVSTLRLSVGPGVGPREIVIALPLGHREAPAHRSMYECARCKWTGYQFRIEDFPQGTKILYRSAWKALQQEDLPLVEHSHRAEVGVVGAPSQ